MTNILEKLNEEQRKPVLDTEGAVLVLAGAGSGKTRVLTSRIAYLIQEKEVSPADILAITFTNKAAREMRERIDAMTDATGMWISTIHSMCVRILRKNADRLGFTDKFSIYTETERNNVVKQSFKECDYDDEKLLKNIRYHIANAKTLALSPEAYTEYYLRHEGGKDAEAIEKVYTRYMQHLRENNALDFDDLLLFADRLLRDFTEVREYYAAKFRYILVDEFQDTNAVQFSIIRRLASVHGNLFAVGDDDQSIYGWRGADIDNILSFEKIFSGAKVYKLERNYRSTGGILDLANTVIGRNRQRKAKTLWTENPQGERAVCFEAENETEEAVYVAREIAQAVRSGASFSDFAVLMRINALTRSFEQEFTKYGLPYKVFGGFRFYERKEIKDMLAYLRIAANPYDGEAVLRVINFPRRGIGDKTVEVVRSYAAENECNIYDALLDADDLPLNAGTRGKLKEFATLLKNLVLESQELPINALVRYLIEKTDMLAVYSDNSEESLTKRANIDEFQNAVDEYVRLNPNAALEDYINEIALSSDTDDMDEGSYITLATIHAVKGLEFNCVFLCGMEENILPSSRALNSQGEMEEERRLAYVAITRAKRQLYFTRSKSRYLYGKREATARSPFLKELAEKLSLAEEEPVYKRYEGDFYGSSYGYDRGRDYGYGKGYKGYSSPYSARSARYSEPKKDPDEGLYQTFGGGTKRGNPPVSSGMGRGNATSFSHSVPKTSVPALHDDSVYKTGMQVEHPKFGRGVVISMRGNPGGIIVSVQFEKCGVKELSARHAPMTVIP